jgi:hypothetical protein
MWDDPIVKHVRKIRQAHAEQFDFDLAAIFADLKERERKSERKVVSFSPKPTTVAMKPDAS